MDERGPITDGEYRPELWINNRWRGVSYSRSKDSVLLTPTGKRVRGRFIPQFFDTEEEAQVACDKLNKHIGRKP